MKFHKYQHVERLGVDETEGILNGTVYVFPKIDGACGTIYLGDNGELVYGSRHSVLGINNHEISLGKDTSKEEAEKYLKYLTKHPTHRLYGEWLIPQNLKTYKDTAWRKFYIFDVCTDDEKIDKGTGETFLNYMPYEIYSKQLDEFGIEYIKPLSIYDNPTMEQLEECLNNNTFLIKEGKGYGEGIVNKNYNFVNRYGRTNWAKMLHSEFQHKSTIKNKEKVEILNIEEVIVEKYVTNHFVEKEYSKISNEKNDKQSTGKVIELIYKTLLEEESYHFVREFRCPTINFKTLKILLIEKIKTLHPELFGIQKGENKNETN